MVVGYHHFRKPPNLESVTEHASAVDWVDPNPSYIDLCGQRIITILTSRWLGSSPHICPNI